jgi:uncharacterized membrane protein
MQLYAWQYAVALLIFLVIDAVWLSTAGRMIYVSEMGSLLRDKPDFVIAFGFYLIFIAGLVGFVIYPAHMVGSLPQAVMMGAFFGLVTYATYDLTNLATLKGFTPLIAIVDLVWGAVLSASVSGLTILALRALKVG